MRECHFAPSRNRPPDHKAAQGGRWICGAWRPNGQAGNPIRIPRNAKPAPSTATVSTICAMPKPTVQRTFVSGLHRVHAFLQYGNLPGEFVVVRRVAHVPRIGTPAGQVKTRRPEGCDSRMVHFLSH